jgi:hypothetical protein
MAENWSSRDVERDPQGFLETQRKEREEHQAERDRQNEQVALAQFTERFVAAGGERDQAASAFKAYRNEQAADAARQADQRAPGYAPEQDEGGVSVAGLVSAVTEELADRSS